MNQQILKDLNHVKVTFQLRAIQAAMGNDNEEHMPEINSVWMDKTSGDYVYRFKGISSEKSFVGKMHFASFNFKTGEESAGGLWLGKQRFINEMVPVENVSKQPCCGHPTLYPSLWCDDCGYETWAAARTAKENDKHAEQVTGD